MARGSSEPAFRSAQLRRQARLRIDIRQRDAAGILDDKDSAAFRIRKGMA